jgi:AbrB family looped-hinge helix DNA binding protein
MVENMEYILKMDKQGRIVLPVHIRKAIGIKEGEELLVRLNGSRIIIEPFSKDLKKGIEEWINLVRNSNLEVFTEKIEESWKWMSYEYARRKLGLS